MSGLEDTLLFQMRCVGLTGFKREYRFHPQRRWRADFAFPDEDPPLLVEVEGGVYSRGRHVRPKGFEDDAKKYAEATLLGYRVLRLTGKMVTSGEGLKLVQRALEREE